MIKQDNETFILNSPSRATCRSLGGQVADHDLTRLFSFVIANEWYPESRLPWTDKTQTPRMPHFVKSF
jgi:hypothetical protein